MITNESQEKETLYSYCLQSNNTALLKEWNTEKNGNDQPWTFSFGSHRKVWWKCEHGHEWQAEIKSRVQGSGCPVCSDRIVIAGVNDLQTTHPAVASEWHPVKNGDVSPNAISAGTSRKYWWKCEHGHEWFAAVSTRTRGSGCPICAGKRVVEGFNDFASLFPELAKEWITEKNLPLTPETVMPYSNKRVWWRCEKGHEWQAYISARTSSSSGCPYCTGRMVLAGFNDLATLYPEIAAEWHPTKNGELTPSMVTAGSRKRVWWRCAEGHEWRAIICSRTGKKKHGCPVCNGRYPARNTLNVYLASSEQAKDIISEERLYQEVRI